MQSLRRASFVASTAPRAPSGPARNVADKFPPAEAALDLQEGLMHCSRRRAKWIRGES
jgi:hypothetical protein